MFSLAKIIPFFSRRLVPGGLFLLSVFLYATESESTYEIGKNCWTIGIRLLIFLMFIKPVAVVGVRKGYAKYVKFFTFWLKYRRELGISTFYFIFFHGFLLSLAVYQFGESPMTLYSGTYVMFWILGLFTLFVGRITSNNYAVKLLKKKWKWVQSVAYLSLLFSFIHLIMPDPTGSGIFYGVLGGIFLVLKFFEWKG